MGDQKGRLPGRSDIQARLRRGWEDLAGKRPGEHCEPGQARGSWSLEREPAEGAPLVLAGE